MIPFLANIHSYAEQNQRDNTTPLGVSIDCWSLGFLMKQVMERWSTLAQTFNVGDVLEFDDPDPPWSSEAENFLRNTGILSLKELRAVGPPLPNHVSLFSHTFQSSFLKQATSLEGLRPNL